MKGVEYWVSKWERTSRDYTWESEEERVAVLSTTGRSPAFWRQHAEAELEMFAAEIKAILGSCTVDDEKNCGKKLVATASGGSRGV